MALMKEHDYVFAAGVDTAPNVKGLFVGTRTHLYVVPDRQQKDRGFLAEALSNNVLYESIKLEGRQPLEVITDILQHPDTTLDQLHKFFVTFKKTWDPVEIYDIESFKVLKVSKGFWFFGGSIAGKKHGDRLYSAIVMRIPRPDNVPIAAFYADIVARING